MKRILYVSLLLAFACGCSNYLDLDPRNKVQEDIIVSSEPSILAYAANLYGRIPIEDFNWSPYNGFVQGNAWSPHNSCDYCDESINSQFDDIGPESSDLWGNAYKLIRDVNLFIEKNSLFQIDESKKEKFLGEGYMMRAITYAELAKRYGGVPLISKAQQFDGDVDHLKVPRSTEYETWKYVMSQLDSAALYLGEDTGVYRFTRWSALAYKTRYALYAASIAKFSQANGVVFGGEAADKKLVGMDASQADEFYKDVLRVGEELIISGKYGLYHPSPASPDEAATNYQTLFESPESCMSVPQEPIFCRGYKESTYLTHNYDIFNRPIQLSFGWKYPGRCNPTLDLVDEYDDYTDDGLNNSGVRILTTVGGVGDSDYSGYRKDANYLEFSNLQDIFKNKDARLRASIILPGSTYKNTKIIIQGGLVQQSGEAIFRTSVGNEGIAGKDGKAYYTYGAADKLLYSGFDPTGSGSYTRSGFLVRKWMQESRTITAEAGYGDNTWIDMRYAEVLLNFAEAAIECSSSTSAQRTMAQKAINDIRHRAAHTDNLSLTGNLNNDRAMVRNERCVELAFENKRYWDLYRWRIFHTTFVNRKKMSLVPFIDLRENPPKYIFVRMYMPEFIGQTFFYTQYYRQIPGTANSGLVQNP
jgi:hypothetical protein